MVGICIRIFWDDGGKSSETHFDTLELICLRGRGNIPFYLKLGMDLEVVWQILS